MSEWQKKSKNLCLLNDVKSPENTNFSKNVSFWEPQ